MIKVRNLWKRFGSLEVLRGLDLDVETGSTLVILGLSGSGKSVLLKHIIGLEQPDEGYIDIDEKRITSMSSRERFKALSNMGMLFQAGALFDSMNIAENTAFYLEQHGDPKTGRPLSNEEIEKRVTDALDMVGLNGTQNKMPNELSGGMRKRAALARLIVYRPEILLYDEPTTGLDPITSMQINTMIHQIQKELVSTSIVITHDIHSAMVVGDNIAFINEGKISHFAKKEEFIKIDDPLIRAFLQNYSPPQPRDQKENRSQ